MKLNNAGTDATPVLNYIQLMQALKPKTKVMQLNDGRIAAYTEDDPQTVQFYGDANPNRPFNPDGTPNQLYQDYELRMKRTGVKKR